MKHKKSKHAQLRFQSCLSHKANPLHKII